MVIIKNIHHLHNVIASDQVTSKLYTEAGHAYIGHTVSNAFFHFSRGAPILKAALNSFKDSFQYTVWSSGGPDLLQKSLLGVCGYGSDVPHNSSTRMTKERFNSERCGGVSVLDSQAFYPIGWRQQEKLYDHKTRSDWYQIFQESYAVHFFQSSPKRHPLNENIMRPKYYGARKPAYLVLALDHCPVAYWSILLTIVQKYQPSGAGGTRSPPAKPKMAARGPKNGRRGLEMGLTLGYWPFGATFAK